MVNTNEKSWITPKLIVKKRRKTIGGQQQTKAFIEVSKNGQTKEKDDTAKFNPFNRIKNNAANKRHSTIGLGTSITPHAEVCLRICQIRSIPKFVGKFEKKC